MDTTRLDYGRLCSVIIRKIIPKANQELQKPLDLEKRIDDPGIISGQADTLSYNTDYHAVLVPEQVNCSSDTDLFVSVGEEVMHYLHHMVRPEVFGIRSTLTQQIQDLTEEQDSNSLLMDYFANSNYIEAVGQLGGLIFAESQSIRADVLEHIKTELEPQVKDGGKHLNVTNFSDIDADWDALMHIYGYALAGSIYQKNETHVLKELFFLDPTKLGEICKRYEVPDMRKPES